jgi:hypothetical protein
MIVSVQFECPPVGKTLLLATNRFSTPNTLQFSSTTPASGDDAILVAPMWW